MTRLTRGSSLLTPNSAVKANTRKDSVRQRLCNNLQVTEYYPGLDRILKTTGWKQTREMPPRIMTSNFDELKKILM